MLVEMQVEILDGQTSGLFSNGSFKDESSGLFSNEPFEKRPVMTIEDFVLHSNDHFESYHLGTGNIICGKSSLSLEKLFSSTPKKIDRILCPQPSIPLCIHLDVSMDAPGKNWSNRGQSRPMMSAIDVTAKTIFERL